MGDEHTVLWSMEVKLDGAKNECNISRKNKGVTKEQLPVFQFINRHFSWTNQTEPAVCFS
jgi:hypothetical protein